MEKDLSLWKFNLRRNIDFSNGDEIDLKSVVSSLKRSIYLQKIRGSKNPLTEYLSGVSNWNRLGDDLMGISINTDSNALVLKFDRPIDNLLSYLSFGIFGIVHQSNFDMQTGEWKNSEKVVYSGAYEVLEQENQRGFVVLGLREATFSKLLGSDIKPFKKIVVNWRDENLPIDFIDNERSGIFSEKNLRFVQRGPKNGIEYVEVIGFKHNPFLKKIENRKILRDTLFTFLKEEMRPDLGKKSFIPNEQCNDDYSSTSTGDLSKLTTLNVFFSERPGTLRDDLRKLLPKFGDKHNIKIGNKSEDSNFNKNDFFTKATSVNKYDLVEGVDLVAKTTEISVEKGSEDVRFMFLSKEGIMLPDLSGAISRALKNKIFDICLINQSIWEDAIVWPIGYFKTGYYFNEKNK
ncbi:MAG: ABC transporter substrate-binding protein [Bdellovibrionota bacterium]